LLNSRTQIPEYSIVAPVYNSAPILPELIARIEAVFSKLNADFEIIIVDDASTDDSWQTLCKLKEANRPHLRIFRLAHNFGQPIATTCGIHHSKGKKILTLDDDLQHLPEEIPKLINRFETGGFKLVFAIPSKKKQPFNVKIYAVFAKTLFDMFIMPAYRKTIYFSSFRIFARSLFFENQHGSEILKGFHLFYIWELSPLSIGNVTVEHKERRFTKSSYNFFRRLKAFKVYLFYAGVVLSRALLISSFIFPIAIGFLEMGSFIKSVKPWMFIVFFTVYFVSLVSRLYFEKLLKINKRVDYEIKLTIDN